MGGDETTEAMDAVLDAAEELISEGGAEGWSLSDLANRAGVAPEDVTELFESEWDAFCHVIRRDEQRFEKVTFDRREGARPSERIVRVFEATVPDYDWIYWIELWSLALHDDRAKALCRELDERFRDGIEEIIKDGVSLGEFDVKDTRQIAVTIATLVDAMATNATLGDSTVRPNYMLDACVSVASELLGTDLAMPSRAT